MSYYPHLQTNQTHFELVRDIATLIGRQKYGDTLLPKIRPTTTPRLYGMQCNEPIPCGPSEAADAMSDAYLATYDPTALAKAQHEAKVTQAVREFQQLPPAAKCDRLRRLIEQDMDE